MKCVSYFEPEFHLSVFRLLFPSSRNLHNRVIWVFSDSPRLGSVNLLVNIFILFTFKWAWETYNNYIPYIILNANGMKMTSTSLSLYEIYEVSCCIFDNSFFMVNTLCLTSLSVAGLRSRLRDRSLLFAIFSKSAERWAASYCYAKCLPSFRENQKIKRFIWTWKHQTRYS